MKKLFFAIILLFSFTTIFAQVASNPQEDFYYQVERWEALGIIETQPSLRPYSLPLINKILESVIEDASETEAQTARTLWNQINGRPWKLILDVNGYAKKSENLDKRILANYGADGDFSFLRFLSAGYNLECLTDIFSNADILPYNKLFPYSLADGYGETIKNYLEVNGNLAANFNNWYFQTGINHNSFGPFYDESVVFSPFAKHTANFSLSYNSGKWNYTQALFVLSATSALSDYTQSQKYYPNKLMFLHSIDWNITKWISVTGYETAIYGNRFDPSYFIPLPYMVTQGVTGYDEDNLLMGIAFNLKPVKGFTWSSDFYLDDIGFTGLKEYHDIKLHCAAQTGVKYVPQNFNQLQLIKLNYTMLTPYMYSHWQNVVDSATGNVTYGTLSTINYQDYKNAGQTIGSALAPNSDKIALTAKIIPVKNLTIDFGASLIRHANVTEGLSEDEMLSYLASSKGTFITDGSINQTVNIWNFDSNSAEYSTSAWNKMMFLTQATKEYCFQADVDVSYTFPECKIGKFTFGLGYTFEYIKNYGVDTEMLEAETIYPHYTNDVFDGYTLSKNSDDLLTSEELDSIINSEIASWKAQLTNLTNHYFRLNFKYQF